MCRPSLKTAEPPGALLSTSQIAWPAETRNVGGFVDQIGHRGFWRKRELHEAARTQQDLRWGEPSLDHENSIPKIASTRVDDPSFLEHGGIRTPLPCRRMAREMKDRGKCAIYAPEDPQWRPHSKFEPRGKDSLAL